MALTLPAHHGARPVMLATPLFLLDVFRSRAVYYSSRNRWRTLLAEGSFDESALPACSAGRGFCWQCCTCPAVIVVAVGAGHPLYSRRIIIRGERTAFAADLRHRANRAVCTENVG